METKPNRMELRRIMAERDLKAPDVGRILGREPQTVNLWCSKVGQDIPDCALQKLKGWL